MGLRRLKKDALGAGGMLVLVTTILLATSWGSAVAAQISNVFVTNDASHPVPVHEQGTASVSLAPGGNAVTSADQTQVVLEHEFAAGGATQLIDVSGYDTIRIASGSSTNCNSSTVLNLKVIDIPHAYTIDDVSPCGVMAKTYSAPGTTLALALIGDPGTSVDIIVLGRRN
jgi:hypothetical protein